MIESAGILAYRQNNNEIEVLLCEAGGPYYKNVTKRWGIPKGEKDEVDFDLRDTAVREFKEETNLDINKELVLLGTFRTTKTKNITIYLLNDGDIDLSKFKSNTFTMEYPKKTGRIYEGPENDSIAWIKIEDAKDLIFFSQIVILEALEDWLIRKE